MNFDLTRAQKRQSSVTAGTFIALSEFLAGWKAQGFTGFLMNLEPKNGGVPNLVITNGTEDLLINLGRPVAEAYKSGKITKQELLGLQVADGKNQKGELRYYLAKDGREFTAIDQVIAAAVKIREVMRSKANITDISKLLEI